MDLRAAGALLATALATGAGMALAESPTAFTDAGQVQGRRVLAVGDIGGTPGLDLVTASLLVDGVVPVYQQSDGSFAQGAPVGGVTLPQAAAVADFTGDGRADVAAFGAGGGALLTQGVDGLLSPSQTLDAGVYTSAAAAAGDLSGDGRADLVVATDSAGALYVQNPTGGLGPPTPLPGLNGGAAVSGLALAPLDGDGLQDVVAAGPNGLVTLLSSASFAPARVATSASVIDFALADLDRDGRVDLLAVEGDVPPERAVLMRGAGNGTFGAEVPLAVGDRPRWIRAGQLDGEGGLDLVVVNRPGDAGRPPDQFTLLGGRGDGTFASAAPLGLTPPEPLLISALFVADLDRNGFDDVVFNNDGLQSNGIATNKSLRPPPPRSDTRPPGLTVRALPRSVAPSARAVVVKASCDEACTLTATGSVSVRVGRRARTRAMMPAQATVAAGVTASLRVRIPSGPGIPLRAAIRLTARDLAGNAAPTRRVTLRVGSRRGR